MNSRIDPAYVYAVTPRANPDAVVQGEKYRFTVLTPTLIRMEFNEDGKFEDRATKVVTNRVFPVPEFTVKETDRLLKIVTSRLVVTYHKNKRFCPAALTARYTGEWGDKTDTWRFEENEKPYGDEPQTYFGTLPALDIMGGPVPLEKGLMSWHFTDWDDSKSPILCDDGWVEERPNGVIDTYLFAYREHHLECLHDFLQLSGKIPMLPRYALGNWWSRYHQYTDTEYKAVIEQFAEKKIPLSVAVLDMDWHITKIDKQYGTGWTGYTWNRELFPNPEDFLSWLHDHGLEVTVNLHDREGVAPHEDCYREMAQFLQMDPDSGEKIEFNFCDPKYVEAYFKFTHHPNEKMGISFWWVDGIPRNTGEIMNADIPWMMNHFHCVDLEAGGKRAMLLSRNCGLGGQRYGVGFSGDTYATWEMLDFLPYFTATASNVGFGWWSHDIGGFINGVHDDELMARWTQMGVFSPITRLHSCDNPFMSKEPWRFGTVTEQVMTDYLRLRHALIPYLYTMNYRCWHDNIPLIRPLYYYCPSQHGHKNEYYFGDEMLVCPITTKADNVTEMGHCAVYLPQGMWFDFFTNRTYCGDRRYNVYRDIYHTPVFVPAGGIIPQGVSDKNDAAALPTQLKIDLFPGADNTFELYEDDGVSLSYRDGDGVLTKMALQWSENPVFVISRPEGNRAYLPQNRRYQLCFRKIAACNQIFVTANGTPLDFQAEYINGVQMVSFNAVDAEIRVSFGATEVLKNDYVAEMDQLLAKMKIGNTVKWEISRKLHETSSRAAILAMLAEDRFDANFRNAACEILTADME